MKKVLILGAGKEQCSAILTAKNLGYHTIVCDANMHAPGLLFANKSFVLDIRNEDKIFQIATQEKIDGIFSHGVEIPDVVSKVASKMGLPGISPEVADVSTNKLARIERLTSGGIPCARYNFADNAIKVKLAANEIGYPVILKPIDNAGARGVIFVKSASEIEESYYESIKSSRQNIVLIEEVLIGPQLSTESVIYNGKVFTFAIADRNYSSSDKFLPYIIEDGINFPSQLDYLLIKEVEKLVEDTIKCLGINFGAAKGDVIIHNGKPMIIEMACRTSGGFFGSGSILYATGSDYLEPLIQMSVGDVPNLNSLNGYKELACAQRYIIAESEGRVKDIIFDEDYFKMDGVELITLNLPNVGDFIEKTTSHASRLGQVICTDKNLNLAILKCEKIINSIKLVLE